MKQIILSITLFILLIVVGIIASCRKPLFKSEKLTLSKETIKPTNLRIDGYYYKLNGNFIYDVIFFYENSTVFVLDAPMKSSFNEVEAQLMDNDFKEHSKISRDYWGRWNLNGNIIKYEKWIPRDGPFPVYMFIGTVLNDTSVTFLKSYRSKNGKEVQVINERYHFKQFSPKPDSTNNFVNE